MKAFEFTIIKTERLLLRQFIKSDLENVFKGLSHPDVIKYYGISYTSLEATKTQMQFFADLEKNETRFVKEFKSLIRKEKNKGLSPN